jgi:hypothetical protein
VTEHPLHRSERETERGGDRERGRDEERERGKEGEREKEGRRDRERELLLLFLKEMTGALAPFSYLVKYIRLSNSKGSSLFSVRLTVAIVLFEFPSVSVTSLTELRTGELSFTSRN